MAEEFLNQLHYGDNLIRLRGEGVDKAIADEVADLIYLDPPFNSQRQYSALFKQHKGQDSPAQIMTFEDTWTYSGLIHAEFKNDKRNAKLFGLVDSLHKILGDSEMMAYVLMMAPRLLELHKKLKPTGSLYLHCDPVASHYLKIILDVVFGPENFRNEITWRRSDAHNDAKHQFGRVSDRILFYVKTSKAKFHVQHVAHTDKTLRDWYLFLELADGTVRKMTKSERETQEIPTDARRFNTGDLSSPNPRKNLMYDYKGYPHPAKGWRCDPKRMAELDAQGLLLFPNKPDGRIMFKRYLDEQPGAVCGDMWSDISMVRGAPGPGREARGYQTQKPLDLLERIIDASTKVGGIVLDPFAGCGTAIVQAERMNRRWIGIDVTYLAINEIVNRLKTEKHHDRKLVYELLGTPKDEDAARALFRNTEHQNHKPFEQWAVTLVGGRYSEKGGMDRGVDGEIDLYDMKGDHRLGLVQIKGGNSMTASNVRDFAHVIEREKAVFGIMIGQKLPTDEMTLTASKLGYAEWPGTKKIPRYQILTTEGILERGEQAIIPENWLIAPEKGVGKAVKEQSETLFDKAQPVEP